LILEVASCIRSFGSTEPSFGTLKQTNSVLKVRLPDLPQPHPCCVCSVQTTLQAGVSFFLQKNGVVKRNLKPRECQITISWGYVTIEPNLALALQFGSLPTTVIIYKYNKQ
jgi:hypothetical protein